eukprot:GHVO01003618.1.p1 GENE.GHVO01003618.1~~GHVO01003618.1.p1  ORF type:complete len:240 (+),score=33.71 GHVO01003618.1:60-779(+)
MSESNAVHPENNEVQAKLNAAVPSRMDYSRVLSRAGTFIPGNELESTLEEPWELPIEWLTSPQFFKQELYRFPMRPSQVQLLYCAGENHRLYTPIRYENPPLSEEDQKKLENIDELLQIENQYITVKQATELLRQATSQLGAPPPPEPQSPFAKMRSMLSMAFTGTHEFETQQTFQYGSGKNFKGFWDDRYNFVYHKRRRMVEMAVTKAHQDKELAKADKERMWTQVSFAFPFLKSFEQ